MSLLVWLPLNGNLKNKGVGTLSSDFSISSPTYSAGKTGNNLKISSQQSNVVTINELTNKKNVTISFWFCPNSGNTFGQWRDVISFGVSNGTTVSSFRMEASSSTGKNFGWWGNGILTSDGGCCGYTLNLDTWYHITIVLNGTTIKKYINGGLQETFTIPTSYANNYYFTGTMTLGDVSMYVSLADVRIYDECLSVKQIKEISKGLVLHYPLNSGYGNENLIIGSGKYTKNTPLVRTRNAVDGWQKESTLYTDTIEAGTYTLQAKTDGNWHNHSTPSGGYSPDLKYCSIWLVSDAANNESGKDITICLGQTVPKSIVLSYKGKYWIRTNLYSNGTDNLTINFWDFKLEKGEKCSLWSPNKNDALYSTLGYNSTTVYDTSGFGNNAEKINTPFYTSDTALYDSCINFNQSGYLKNTSLDLYANKLTICFWVKMPNTIITQHFLFSTHNDWTHNGVGMWRDNSTEKGYYLLIKSNTETTFSRPFIGINADTWTFISISYTGKQYSVYKNGSLYQTVDYGNDGQVYNPVLYLGNSLYNGTPSTETDEALMSDFRIYATALTADDIKQLYQTKAKIDKNGNLYCNQFIEIDNERNLLDTDDYWISGQTSGTYKQEKIECSDSVSGTATKITCTAAGSGGFYMSGHKVFDKTTLINGKQYIISLYAKSDNRTSIRFNVECSSKQSKSTFTIGAEYRRICIIYTYSNTPTYNAFTSYGGWKVNENIYIHSLKVTEYNPKSHIKNNSVIETNSFTEIGSENETKIYKQDIQSNEIIEI